MLNDVILDKISQSTVGFDRCLIAIAGPPGAGKSTLADELLQRFPPGTAKVLPMDGFHYDNAVLDQLGLRSRKGAPETFDFEGLTHILKRIRDREPSVAIPVFDRDSDLSRAGASVIPADTRIVLVEGNYLLVNQPPWDTLKDLFDLTVFLDVPRPELQRRLLARWDHHGWSKDKAEHWIATNDLPNIDLVLTKSRPADFTLT